MYFWEFIQNLPLVAGLLVAIDWWQAAMAIPSLVAMLSGSLLGAILIRLTERNIFNEDHMGGLIGNREPIAVTVTNVVLMFLLMLILTVYLTAVWSNPLTDLAVGSLIGFGLSASQSKAANQPVSGRHSLAFAAAFPIALIILRTLSAALPISISILLITVVVTLIITYVDYGHLTSAKGGTK